MNSLAVQAEALYLISLLLLPGLARAMANQFFVYPLVGSKQW